MSGKPNEFIYTTKQAEVAISKIFYAVEQRQGLVVVTGEAGTGKSTLARQMLLRWEADEAIIPAYINRPDAKYAAGFLREILTAFHLPEHYLAAENENVLRDYLLGRQRAGQTCILVIDNAHRLSANGQFALQRLFEMHTDDGPLLQVVLLALPVLARKVNDRAFLGRRVGSRAMLDELTFEDAVGLLRHRHSGADFDHLLPPSLHRSLYDTAAGNPGALCQLCDQLVSEVSGLAPAQVYKTAAQPPKQWLSLSAMGS